jgi:glycerophosphoryl diester phosphodiesterase
LTSCWLSPKKATLLVAHRGASALAPENTLAAFRKAIEEGADAIELDVHLSKDGEVVVIHDSRLERTTDGKGNVSKKAVKELKQYSAGAWFNRKFSSERIPLLREVFEMNRHRVAINIEIKGHHIRRNRYDVVEKCIKLAREYHALSDILITSFDHGSIKKVKDIEPGIAAGVLHHSIRDFRKRPSKLVAARRAAVFNCSKRSFRKRMVRDLHGHGYRIGVYTVDNPETYRKLAKAGVDFMYTNDITALRHIIIQDH